MYRNILAIQYEAGNRMAPEGNCLQYHTASSGTFASFAWDFATYGEAQAATTTGIAPYTQFHLANQHYNVCFRREQGKTAICYTPKILGNRFKPLLCIKSHSRKCNKCWSHCTTNISCSIVWTWRVEQQQCSGNWSDPADRWSSNGRRCCNST